MMTDLPIYLRIYQQDLLSGGKGTEGGNDDDGGNGAAEDSLAEGAIYRLMASLGGKTMLPIAMAIIPTWLGNTESWQQRRVALIVISALVDYCSKIIKASVGDMTKTAVDFTKV